MNKNDKLFRKSKSEKETKLKKGINGTISPVRDLSPQRKGRSPSKETKKSKKGSDSPSRKRNLN